MLKFHCYKKKLDFLLSVSRPKKKLSCFLKSKKHFSSLTCPHSLMCIRIYTFCFRQKNTHITHRNKKQKKLKKTEKQTKPKKKGRKKMLLLLTISVENLTGYDDSFWQLFRYLCVLLT